MATQLFRVPTQNNLQYTLAQQLAQGASTAVLNTDVTGIVQTPGVFVVDRVDSSGNKTPTVREYISFTGQSTTNLTGLTKGLGGSTDQQHSVGAIVEFIPDVVWADSYYQVQTREHDVFGVHISLASLKQVSTLNLAAQSTASLQALNVSNYLNASGASILAFPLVPTFTFGGVLSAASANLGIPLTMPRPGNVLWVDATTRIGSSGASLFLDLTKNGVGIINANASQSVLTIPINGTFVSTSSLSSPTFNAGDVFNFSILGANSLAQDISFKFYAR